MFELCEAKSGYVYNLDVYTGAHSTNLEHNTFIVVDRLGQMVSSPKSSTIYGVAKQRL